jgi:hypothetical protein
MRFASTAFALAVLLLSSTAAAGNSDEVNAGVDVTLTGGAVVANVTTGAALWYNPTPPVWHAFRKARSRLRV